MRKTLIVIDAGHGGQYLDGGIHYHIIVNNQMYGNELYTTLLEDVVKLVKYYLPYFNTTIKDSVIIDCAWLHDIVEDCNEVNIDLIQSKFGVDVSSIIGVLTVPKGLSRKEVLKSGHYVKIGGNSVALFIKLCDRMANIENVIKCGKSSLLKMYGKEHKYLMENTTHHTKFQKLVEDLNKVIKPYIR